MYYININIIISKIESLYLLHLFSKYRVCGVVKTLVFQHVYTLCLNMLFIAYIEATLKNRACQCGPVAPDEKMAHLVVIFYLIMERLSLFEKLTRSLNLRILCFFGLSMVQVYCDEFSFHIQHAAGMNQLFLWLVPFWCYKKIWYYMMNLCRHLNLHLIWART